MAQTRFFSASYNNSSVLFLDENQEGLATGKYGVNVGTFKFKDNHTMRGFSFTYGKMATENTLTLYNSNTNDYSNETFNGSMEKMSLGYETYRLWGKKEIDDPGAFYGTMGYYIDYYSEQKVDKAYEYARTATIDFNFKIGIGYQHMIGKQFVAFGEYKGSLSIVMNLGYEYNLGIRYRGLGEKR